MKFQKIIKKLKQAVGTKYLPLVQIQSIKGFNFWLLKVGSILFGSTMWHLSQYLKLSYLQRFSKFAVTFRNISLAKK